MIENSSAQLFPLAFRLAFQRAPLAAATWTSSVPCWDAFYRRSFAKWILFAFVVALGGSVDLFACQPELLVEVQLKSGTVIRGNVEPSVIRWTDIEPTGQTRTRDISLADVVRLQLAGESVAKLVDSSNQLILDLNSADYRARETAEQMLIQRLQSSQAGSIRPLLELAAQQSVLEVQYRVERILKAATTSSPQSNRSLKADIIQTNSAGPVTGDSGDLELKLQREGKSLTLNRDQIRMIHVLAANGESKPLTRQKSFSPLNEQAWASSHLPIADPRRTEMQLIDFESDSFGLPLVKDPNQKLDQMFVERGLILSAADGVGHIGISPFFKMIFAGRPTGENSICVFDTRGSLKRRHIGITEFEFCLPGQPLSAAGVHQFELYAGEINNARDFVMQAFNQDGQLIASVEASDELGCCFQVESREPIALIRFLTNPYLFELKRDIDNDYALDNVSFSTPVPISPQQAIQKQAILRSWAGETFATPSFSITESGDIQFASEELGGTQTLPLDSMESIVWAHATRLQPQPNSNRWFALTSDRSVIEVRPGDRFTSTRFEQWSLGTSDVHAIWSAADFLRFPWFGDFSEKRPLLVFPTGRVIAPDLQIDATGIDWSQPSSDKRLQEVFIKPVNDDERVKQKHLRSEDPLPRYSKLEWANANVAQWPSVWFSPPPPIVEKSGGVWLSNGELFRFGGELPWQMAALLPDQIELVHTNGNRFSIKWSEVVRLAFPQK